MSSDKTMFYVFEYYFFYCFIEIEELKEMLKMNHQKYSKYVLKDAERIKKEYLAFESERGDLDVPPYITRRGIEKARNDYQKLIQENPNVPLPPFSSFEPKMNCCIM